MTEPEQYELRSVSKTNLFHSLPVISQILAQKLLKVIKPILLPPQIFSESNQNNFKSHFILQTYEISAVYYKVFMYVLI